MTIYSSLGGSGGGGTKVQTINGDSGSITGATVTIYADTIANNSGSSVSFVNSGTTSTFNVTDSTGNTCIGKNSGSSTIGAGTGNTSLGQNSLTLANGASSNVSIGYNSLNACVTGSFNVSVGDNTLTAFTGSNTVAIGGGCLQSLTSGQNNTGVGYVALQSLTTGGNNTCLGAGAGQSFVGNDNNTAIGYNVLNDNTGDSNTVVGSEAGGGTGNGAQNALLGFQAGVLLTNGTGNTGIGYAPVNALTTGSYNTSIGWETLFSLATGSYNTALGYYAGSQLNGSETSNIYVSNVGVTGESHVMRLGTTGSGNNQVNKSFMAGVYGVTVGGSGIAVVVDNAGQLGTVVSSERFKEDIQPIQNESILLQNLRPVSFTYRQDQEKTKCFGLIAEEVKEVLPELVVDGEDGKPLTVKYLDLPVLLLAEIQRLHKKIESLEAIILSGEK